MDPNATHSLVLEVLQRASSQNPEILKPAETKLREWEDQPGFYTVLFNVISNHSIDLNVRWMAVLYFKNGVDKYWRKNAPGAISEEEKATLRQSLVSNLREPINQIATQLAVLVSKVARLDCPREWPELFPTLLQAVESNDRLIQHRALLMLHHVVKSISSKRLAGDRKIFRDFTASIYAYILNLWNNFTEAFLRDIHSNQAAELITENLEKALLSLRILRKLTVHGFRKPSESQDAMCFLKVIFERAKSALEARKQLKGKGIYLLELCEKFIIHLTKILLAVLDTHPLSFVDFIQPTLEFTICFLFTPEGANLTFGRFVIQCFNLIKGILLCVEYKPAKIVHMTKDPETLRAHEIKMAFFQPNILTEICRKIVTHYLLLTQDDLAMWDADPETFATDECGESWKYSLRPCIETVFVTLFHEFVKTLAPVLMELIESSNCLVSPDDLPAILRKDAIYNAVGLAGFDLYEEIDFDQWFTNTLTQELKVKDNNYRIIRKRVAWLIGNWTGIKFTQELRPAMYMTTLNLLHADEDMAVRLTASTTLRHAIDDFDFNNEQFRPYLEPAFNLLFNLLKEANECDTKMHILNIMTVIIERVGLEIRPHSAVLIQYLPLLWQDSEEHNMLRCAIVATLVQLVKALNEVIPSIYPFLLPVIQMGTDTSTDAVVYLLEDTLELWLAVLENSRTMTTEYMQLFSNMPALLEYSSENLRLCLLIIQAHILLAPEETLKTQAIPVIATCDSLLADLRSDGILILMRIVETCIRAAPSVAVETIKPILPRIFGGIYRGDECPLVTSMYLSILARVLLASFAVFNEILARLSQMLNETAQNIFNKILDVWISKTSALSLPERRKLLGIALTSLLTVQSNSVLERFPGIIKNVVEILNDITHTDENGTGFDSMVLTGERSPSQFQEDVDYETEHGLRKRQLISSDPVHTVVLREYLQSQLVEVKGQLGQVHYEQLLQMLKPDVLTQLQEYVTF